MLVSLGSSGWLWRVCGSWLSRLLLVLGRAQHLDLESGRIDRERHHGRDDLRRVLERLRHLNEGAERPVDVDIEAQRNLREDLMDEACDEAVALAQRGPFDRHPRR